MHPIWLRNYAGQSKLLMQFLMVNLLPKAQAGTTTLSRGMRQKLAVCCVYLYSPQVLLLDEPLTGLDPPGIRTLLNSVRILADSGTTVIISSHLLAMIEDVCTHDGGPLAEGKLNDHVIVCPRHGAEFDVRDGRALSMPAVTPAPTYEVKVEGEDIFIASPDSW